MAAASLARDPFAHAARHPGGVERTLAWFGWFREHAWARRLILAVNLAGVAYGFWYYLPQFAVTPWYYWPLVPDSPLAVLWATLALWLVAAGRPSPIFEGLAFVGNVEVGLWTGFVLLYYDRVVWPRLDFVLFWLHLAMVGLALVFVHALRTGPRRDARLAVGVAAGYYLLNAVADYWYTGFAYQGCAGLHPISIHPPWDPCLGLDVVGPVTVVLTLVAVGALAVLVLPRSQRSA